MITDQVSKVCDSQDVSTQDPDYSAVSIDLTVSPDMGSGKPLYAIIHVESYDDDLSNGTTISVVTSGVTGLTGNRKIGQFYASAGRLTALVAAPSENLPIIIPFIPDVYSATANVSGVTGRYLGIEFDHATIPEDLTVTAYITDNYQSPPTHSHHAAGMKVL